MNCFKNVSYQRECGWLTTITKVPTWIQMRHFDSLETIQGPPCISAAPLNCNVFICLSSSLNAELVIPATGNVFYAMTSSSVDFLLRKKGGNMPIGSQPISTETSATFPRIKAKGRRLVRTLFWHQILHNFVRVPHRPHERRAVCHKQWMWPSLCKTELHMPFFLSSKSCSTKTPRPSLSDFSDFLLLKNSVSFPLLPNNMHYWFKPRGGAMETFLVLALESQSGDTSHIFPFTTAWKGSVLITTTTLILTCASVAIDPYVSMFTQDAINGLRTLFFCLFVCFQWSIMKPDT